MLLRRHYISRIGILRQAQDDMLLGIRDSLIRDSGGGNRDSGIGKRDSLIRDSGFGIRDSLIRNSGSGMRDSLIRDWGFGIGEAGFVNSGIVNGILRQAQYDMLLRSHYISRIGILRQAQDDMLLGRR